MALNLGNTKLLDSSGEDALRARWQQSGSTIKNGAITVDGTQHVAVTVTAGRTLYITDITMKDSVGGDVMNCLDNATVKQTVETSGTTTYTFQFSTPLKISTSLTFTWDTDRNHTVSWSGWEE